MAKFRPFAFKLFDTIKLILIGDFSNNESWKLAHHPLSHVYYNGLINNFTLWDIPHTTQTSQYKLYYRMHTTGGTRRLYTGWNSHNDSIAVSEIKQ